jgi:hypothetical protein
MGYEGIEAPLKLALLVGKDNWQELMREHNLLCIFDVFTDGPMAPGDSRMWQNFSDHPTPGETVTDHLAVYKAQVEDAFEIGCEMVSCQSGRDFFTEPMADEFFKSALAFEKKNNFHVAHETARGRYLGNPWVARDFLPRHPELKLSLDLSHWVNCADTMPTDRYLSQVVTRLAPQVMHIKARVGYEHALQVPDPRSPVWLPFTEGHERVWDTIWDAQKSKGMGVTTLTPNHAPPPYQQTLPYSSQPVADIYEINHWLALRQKERFAQKNGSNNTARVTLDSELDPSSSTRATE